MTEPVDMNTDVPMPEWCVLLSDGVAYDLSSVLKDVVSEIQFGLTKHGFRQTPLHPRMTNEARAMIVLEEAGEVAGALTYDQWVERGERGFVRELTQTAAMAVAALGGLRLAKVGDDIVRGDEAGAREGEEEAGSSRRSGFSGSPGTARRGTGSPGGDGAGPVVGRAFGRRPDEPREWYR